MKKFHYYPHNTAYTLPELEKLLQFKFLQQIDFETPEEKQIIQNKGLDQLKNKGVSLQSQELGIQFFKEIESSFLPNVSIRWISENLGHGLFAEENLEINDYVGEYTGIIRKHKRGSNHYSYDYPVLDDLGRSLIIDATSGHLTRFINHSFAPNLKPVYAFYDGFYHLIFLAIHPIKKGTQLSYNYGYNYWYTRGQPEAL